MKNLYKTGLLLTALLMSTSVASQAQWNTAVGLDASRIRMSSLQTMEHVNMTPIRSLIGGITSGYAMPLDAEAQQDEQTFGGGLVYGSELEKLGIQLNYYYFLTALLAVGGDFTLFFPESEEAGGVKSTATWMAFNINAHYILFTAIAMRAYVLAGLNFALFRFKVSGGGFSVSDSTSEIGLNLGGGIEYALAVGFLFAELKYIIGEFDQLVIAAGYRYRFGL